MVDLLVVCDQKFGHIVDHAREVFGRHCRQSAFALAALAALLFAVA